MKTTKKVLSVLLALTMLVGLLAVTPLAADPTEPFDSDYAVNLWLGVDKDAYAPGETVTVTVYEQIVSGLGLDGNIAGAYPISYPLGKITPLVDADGDDLTVQNFNAMVGGVDYGFCGILCNASNEANGYTNPTDYGTIRYEIGGDGTTFVATGAMVPMFSVDFVIDASCPDGDYDLSFNQDAYDTLWDGYACGGAVYTGNDFAGTVGNLKFHDITVHVGAAAPADPAFLKAQCQWADGNTAGTLNVGLSATFTTAKFPIAFDSHGKSTNVTAVGIEITSGAYTTTEETRYVYEVDASTYRYRAVITGVPHDATGTITATFYVIMGGVRYDGETKTINLGDVIAASTAAGLPAYTGA